MPELDSLVRVAVPVPLYRMFDYRVPQEQKMPEIGARVWVPFGRRNLIGIVVETGVHTDVAATKLKYLDEVVDQQALLPDDVMQLADWITRYYVSSPGMAYELILPVRLRQGVDERPAGETIWQITEQGREVDPDSLSRAPVQKAIMVFLQQHETMNKSHGGDFSASWRTILKNFIAKGWALTNEQLDLSEYAAEVSEHSPELKLTQQQQAIVSGIRTQSDFKVNLIHGITGSGKTEVYLSVVEAVLEQGRQILLLVPEIGLTPQFVARVKRRLAAKVAVIHSGLTDQQRHKAWWSAKSGEVDIILGTRASVFTPFKDLGLIVVDEEHDASFKQQDGVRYHARDIAIIRARQLAIPVILGSATPSLESSANAESEKYRFWSLTERATGATLPKVHIVDIRSERLNDGLSPVLQQQLALRLEKKQQSILFLNRRGFAPTLYCPECAWVAECQRCNAHLTHHQASSAHSQAGVQCHHCGYQAPLIDICPECHKSSLVPVGLGTQRIEHCVQQLFPEARVMRLDRDATSKKGALAEHLAKIQNNDVDIILGTQMLSKGHDFPNVTLVGVLNADQGIYSADFRGPELMFQQIVQVAGRAGRHQAGEVYIQTSFPEHPIFEQLITQDFAAFARTTLEERQMLLYPPYAYIALLRAESVQAQQGLQFLRWCREQVPQQEFLQVSDAVPAPMEKRAGRFRAQLLFKSTSRKELHGVLQQLVHVIANSKEQRNVRWSLDIDPIDMY